MLEKMQIKQLRARLEKMRVQSAENKERADKAEAALGSLFRAKERLEAETQKLVETRDHFSEFAAELKSIRKELMEKK